MSVLVGEMNSNFSNLKNSTHGQMKMLYSHGNTAKTDFIFVSDDEFEFCRIYKLVVLGGFLFIFGVLGLIGNSLVVFTLWPSRKDAAISFLLIVLAIADSGSILVWWTNLGVPSICNYTESEACAAYIRLVYPCLHVYFWPVGRWFHCTGTWLVVLVTFYRYASVCHPHRFHNLGSLRIAVRSTLAIALLSFVYITPRFCSQYLVWTGERFIRRNTFIGESEFWFNTLYESALYLIVIFAAPLPALAYMTCRLILALRKMKKRRQGMTRKRKDEKDLTKTLIVVIFVFIFCQLGNPIRRITVAFIPYKFRGCDSFYPYYRSIAALLVILNCSINFVIFCFCGERFRNTFVKRIRELFTKHNRVEEICSQTLANSYSTG